MLPLRRPLRESVILRTCVATGNDYEFNLHVQTISQRMGLSWAQIMDVSSEQPDPALWSPPQLAAMELVDALVPRLHVSDATFAACREHLDEAALIEVTQLAGMYVGVAMQVALARPAFDVCRYPEPVLARQGARRLPVRHLSCGCNRGGVGHLPVGVQGEESLFFC